MTCGRIVECVDIDMMNDANATTTRSITQNILDEGQIPQPEKNNQHNPREVLFYF